MHPELKLYNTASRTLEVFTPSPEHPDEVTMYHCGPTVYNVAHIGNLRSYVFADTIRRTIELFGYHVNQVINITDVGHLIGDGDEGEDKMTAALKREALPLTKEAMREVGERYTEIFRKDLRALNIKEPDSYPKASDHIAEDIHLIESLIEGHHAYRTADGIYFDTTTFPNYAKFARLDIAGMRAGARVTMGEKKSATDFALWKFNDALGYEAPFGKGFPGWHIECSAMAMKYLGETIDIHTGGIDHIPVHHTNEIAQSECVTGKPFVRYWMHHAHMTVEGEKMSKSIGNTLTLADIGAKGITPLAYRYWLLTAGYRTTVNFTWEALKGAKSTMSRITDALLAAQNADEPIAEPNAAYLKRFVVHLANDLDTPQAIALLHEVIRDKDLAPGVRAATMLVFDRVLGLGLRTTHEKVSELVGPERPPEDIAMLLAERESAREERNWRRSDDLRDAIQAKGWTVKDTPEGQVASKRE
ncbi:MAG TPA: cysteine--tRNA ligase [Candidatus Paceibacterota bacterium]|nr:cysteine--tRNA ligase [Candidatus Paceibacterota bacterium]